MNFLLVLAAVVIEFSLAGVVRLRSPHWSAAWARRFGAACEGTALCRGWLGALLLLGLPLLAASLVFGWLWEHARLVHHLASLGLLVWMLGPTDLKREIVEYRAAVGDAASEAPAFTATTAGIDLGIPTGDEGFDACRGELAAIALAAERAWFAPLAVFFVLGPVGVLAYRLAVSLEHAPEVPADIARHVARVHEALAFVPARVTALCLGVAGTLVPVLEGAAAAGFFAWGASARLVARSALAATDYGRVEQGPEQATARRRIDQMEALVGRTVNVWLALFALLALL